MKPSASCILVGLVDQVSSLSKLLQAGGVKSRAFVPQGDDCSAILRICGEQKESVVVVMCRAFADGGLGFIQQLPKGNGLKVVAYKETPEKAVKENKPTAASLVKAGADDVFSHYPFRKATAAAHLKKVCFPRLRLDVPEEFSSIRARPAYEDDIAEARERASNTDFQLDDIDKGDGYGRLNKKESPAEKKAATAATTESLNRRERRAQGIYGKAQSAKPASVVAPLARTPKVPSAMVQAKVVKAPTVRPTSPASKPEEVKGSEVWRNIIARVKAAIGKGVYVKVDPASIQAMAGQPRTFFDPIALESLKQSILDFGQMMPGIIRRLPAGFAKPYELLDGERRWRAVVTGGVLTYEAKLVEIDDEAAPFMVATIANFNRESHTPLELSDAIEKLHNGLGIPIEEIAEMHHISAFWATQLRLLQNLHPQIRDLMSPYLSQKKQMPVSAAIAVCKLDPTVQPILVERYRKGEVTIAGLRAEALKVAEETGTYIRRRRDADGPARKLKRVGNQANMAMRSALDFQTLLKDEVAKDALRRDPSVAKKAMSTLSMATGILAKCRKELESLA